MERKKFRSNYNFKVLTKLFFDAAEERYPSSEKIKQLVGRVVTPMGANPLEMVHIQIVIVNALRDMIKKVSPSQIYRSLQHRDDLYLAIIETSEDLEDELEELEEQLEEKE